ncbi:MAG: type II toxin-antitoxin system VapC family toxin [Chloroflexota bacterium]
MKILLDTQVFLWYISGDNRLPGFMLDSIRDADNLVYLSVASFWEIVIKYQLGKLPLPQSPESYIPRQRQRHQIESLIIGEASIAQLVKLPTLHRDPFDRLLICQTIEHGMLLATTDHKIQQYPVPLLTKLTSN